MTFAYQLKSEICNNRTFRNRGKKAQCYGLLLFGKTFSGESVSLHTEHEGIAELYRWFLKSLLRLEEGVELVQVNHERLNTVYKVSVKREEDRKAILSFFGHEEDKPVLINQALLRTPEEAAAFISGVYMACGHISDPAKNYHMEFVPRDDSLCRQLTQLAGNYVDNPKITRRRGQAVLYFKESRQIEELMALMGASKSCLDLMEIEIIKGIRNKVNRVTNCETANIDKTVAAAARQIEDIQLVLSKLGEDNLPEELARLAKSRLENPDLSLSELARQSPLPITRSGVNHRLKRLSQMAEELRQAEAAEEKR